MEAQTLSNAYLAVDSDLAILPVINKIDLPSADAERVKEEIEDIIGIPAFGAPEISAKLGINIDSLLERIVTDIPSPKGDVDAPLKALIFDSQYDNYRGVLVFVRIFDGILHIGQKIKLMQTGYDYEVNEVGHMLPLGFEPCSKLEAGEVGYFTASIKMLKRQGSVIPLLIFRTQQQLCFLGIVLHSLWFTAEYIPKMVLNTLICEMP